MRTLNKVQLIGRLGTDPETKRFEDGNMVTNFALATNESYKDKTGNLVESTDWHNIVIWRKLAEIADTYLKKGSQVYLEGKLKTRSYDDKDGNKRYVTEVLADNLIMLDKKQEGLSEIKSSTSGASATLEEDTSDLPF